MYLSIGVITYIDTLLDDLMYSNAHNQYCRPSENIGLVLLGYQPLPGAVPPLFASRHRLTRLSAWSLLDELERWM